MLTKKPSYNIITNRGGGTGEASEALASPEFRGFTTEKFLASWIYEMGTFSCFTGKKLIPPPLMFRIEKLLHEATIQCVGITYRQESEKIDF